jgi:hypothetical protein
MRSVTGCLRAVVLSVAMAICVSMAATADELGDVSKTLKEGIIGTWTLVSAETVKADGSRSFPFGATPKGILILTGGGHFALINVSSDRPSVVSNDRMTPTNDEQAITQVSLAAFGSFKVDEVLDVLEEHVDASTSPNESGKIQNPLLRLISADELSWTDSTGAATTKLIFKRVT